MGHSVYTPIIFRKHRDSGAGDRVNIFSNIMRGKRKRESDAAADSGVYTLNSTLVQHLKIVQSRIFNIWAYARSSWFSYSQRLYCVEQKATTLPGSVQVTKERNKNKEGISTVTNFKAVHINVTATILAYD